MANSYDKSNASTWNLRLAAMPQRWSICLPPEDHVYITTDELVRFQ